MTRESKLFVDEVAHPQAVVVHAVGMQADIARHIHRKWIVGACISGMRHIALDHSQMTVGPGDLFAIPPHAPHCCRSVGESVCVCFEPSIFTNAAGRSVCLKDHIFKDDGLFDLFSSLRFQKSKNSILCNIIEYIARLCCHYVQILTDTPCHSAVLCGIKYIHERYHERVVMEYISNEIGISPFYFQRIFRKHIGLTPVQYLQRVRTRFSMISLQSGMPASLAALEVGFADQSHMIRTFQSYVGITPGRFLENNPTCGLP